MYYDTTLQEALSRGLKCHSNDLSKSVKFVRLIAKYLQEEYNTIFYGKAQNLGRVLCKAYDEALQKYGVLILPTLPKKAPVFPQENPPLEGVNCLTAATKMPARLPLQASLTEKSLGSFFNQLVVNQK